MAENKSPIAPPRLRLFAGPNGSGKSSMKTLLAADLLGVYLNADDVEAALRRDRALDFAQFGLLAGRDFAAETLFGHLNASPLLQRAGLTKDLAEWRIVDNRLEIGSTPINAYHAAALVDGLRHILLRAGTRFSCETVMSSADKVELLAKAQAQGFRTYLYYVATVDPAINLARVANRVRRGGHDVPADKIVSRYHRSLALLRTAVRHTDRAYIFDNSGSELVWLAEITAGRQLEIKTATVPPWFAQVFQDG